MDNPNQWKLHPILPVFSKFFPFLLSSSHFFYLLPVSSQFFPFLLSSSCFFHFFMFLFFLSFFSLVFFLFFPFFSPFLPGTNDLLNFTPGVGTDCLGYISLAFPNLQTCCQFINILRLFVIYIYIYVWHLIYTHNSKPFTVPLVDHKWTTTGA